MAHNCIKSGTQYTPAFLSQVTDSANNYTSSNVEDALAEVATTLATKTNENSRTLSLVDAITPDPLRGNVKTISGYNVLSMPSNANGYADYVVKGNTMTNLFINGNFSNGTTGVTTGGIIDTTIYRSSTQSLKLDATSADKSAYENIIIPNGHNVYVYCWVYIQSGTATASLSVRDYISANTAVQSIADSSKTNQWQKLSLITTAANGGIKVSAFVSTGSIVNVDDIVVIDLDANTNTIGLTLADANTRFPYYFDGTVSARDCRIRNCGKNLWHPNVAFPFTQNGVTIDYDKITQEYILNGTTTNAYLKIFIGSFSNFKIGDTVTLTLELISGTILADGTHSGSISAGGYNDSDGVSTWVGGSNFISNAIPKSTSTQTLTRNGMNYAMIWVYQPQVLTNARLRVQLEYGSTATAYESYRENMQYIRMEYPHRSLSNGVTDTIDSHGVDTQNINTKVLQASDITFLTTTGVNTDFVRIKKPTDASFYGTSGSLNGALLSSNNMNPYGSYADSTENINVIYSYDGTLFGYIVAKGTYATLVAAQTALTGTTLTYQLATPIISQVNIVGDMQTYPNGTTFVEPCISGFTNTATTTIATASYPASAIKSVTRYDIVNGKLIKTDVTANCTFTATTLTIGSFMSGKTYFYDCDVSSTLSAPPNLVIDVEVDNGIISHDFGASVGAWTLTSNESKATMLTCTNAGGAANIIIPAIDGKMYIVKNTSGYTLTIKTGTSTGITVATAKTATIIYNGTDFMKLSEI